jgi:hypothetical protein
MASQGSRAGRERFEETVSAFSWWGLFLVSGNTTTETSDPTISVDYHKFLGMLGSNSHPSNLRCPHLLCSQNALIVLVPEVVV